MSRPFGNTYSIDRRVGTGLSNTNKSTIIFMSKLLNGVFIAATTVSIFTPLIPVIPFPVDALIYVNSFFLA